MAYREVSQGTSRAEPWTRYVEEPQQDALVQAIAAEGYRMEVKEHGGWGGGTSYVVYAPLSPTDIILCYGGMAVAASFLYVAHAFDGIGGLTGALGLAFALFAAFLIRRAKHVVTFHWSDSGPSWEMDVRSTDRLAEVMTLTKVIEQVSGHPVP